jgi:hypothetical protein
MKISIGGDEVEDKEIPTTYKKKGKEDNTPIGSLFKQFNNS